MHINFIQMFRHMHSHTKEVHACIRESFSARVAEVTHPDDSWVIWQISMKPTEIGTSLQYYKWNFRKNMCVT